MTARAWAWKELREQGPLVALIVFVSLIAAGALTWWALSSPQELSRAEQFPWILGILMAGSSLTAVLVGTAAIAGERETGTLAFLEHVAGGRAAVWRAKATFALAATLVGAALTLGAMLAAGSGQYLAAWALALTLALLGASLFFSSLARSALAACGMTAAGMLVATIGAAYVLSWLGVVDNENTRYWVALWTASWLMLSLVGTWAGRRIYCGPETPPMAQAGAPRRRIGPAWSRALGRSSWLAWRQGAWVLVIVPLVLFTVAALTIRGIDEHEKFGGEPALPIRAFYGPAALVALGVLAGVCALAGDNIGEARRLWADARLPVGRIWGIKIAGWFVWASLTTALCNGWFADDDVYWTSGFSVESRRLLWIAAVALVQSFAIGALVATWVRKSAAAFVLALLLALPAAALWLPSLLMLDFNPLWALGPAVLLLLMARLLVWSWTCGTLRAPHTRATLALGGLMTVGWLGGALAWRAWSIAPPPATLRQETPRAWTWNDETMESVHRTAAEITGTGSLEWSPTYLVEDTQGVYSFTELLASPRPTETETWSRWMNLAPLLGVTRDYSSVQSAWRKGSLLTDLPSIPFEARFNADVVARIAAWPTLPASALRAAKEVPRTDSGDVRSLSRWLLLRDLELVEQGEWAEALDLLLGTLALTRWQRIEAHSSDYSFALDAERVALAILDRWLARQVREGANEELLARAAAGLAEHARLAPPSRTVLDGNWLRLQESDALRAHYFPDYFLPAASLWDLVWLTPWEATRRQRIIDWTFDGWYEANRSGKAPSLPDDFLGRYLWTPSEAFLRSGMNPTSFRALAAANLNSLTWMHLGSPHWASSLSIDHVRAMRLVLACVRFHQAEGRYPGALDELVPRFLDSSTMTSDFRLTNDEAGAALVRGPDPRTAAQADLTPALLNPDRNLPSSTGWLYPLPAWGQSSN